jgi:predicted PurR-regulated permease PerM
MPRSKGGENRVCCERRTMPEQPANEEAPKTGIPITPLSPGERADRDEGSLESAAEAARGERRALGWAAIAAVGVIVWLVAPVGVGVLLGTLLAFALQPVFERLEPRLGKSWASLSLVFATLLALGGALTGLAWMFVSDGTALTNEWIESLGPGGPGHAIVTMVGGFTKRLGLPPDELADRARGLAETAASSATTAAAVIVGTTASSALALVFAMLSMHFILRNWRAVALGAQEAFPLRPDYTATLFAEFRRVGRSTLLGTLGTGVAQGLLATLGFWMTGIPKPFLFGAAAAIASLVPAVGAALVWLPAGLVLILAGHPARGALELVWGTVMVGIVSDYVIRPRLVGGGGHLPSLVTFAALLGGAEVFGLKGLIVGPVLMSLAIAILRLYATEARKRRAGLIADARSAPRGAG